MSRLDFARLQFGMALTNRRKFVPVSHRLPTSTNSHGFRHRVIWHEAAARAEAVAAAPR